MNTRYICIEFAGYIILKEPEVVSIQLPNINCMLFPEGIPGQIYSGNDIRYPVYESFQSGQWEEIDTYQYQEILLDTHYGCRVIAKIKGIRTDSPDLSAQSKMARDIFDSVTHVNIDKNATKETVEMVNTIIQRANNMDLKNIPVAIANKYKPEPFPQWLVESTTSPMGDYTDDYMCSQYITNGNISLYCDDEDISQEELQQICDKLNS